MQCTSCKTLQCYVCKATVKDYNHFDQGGYRGRTSGAASASKKCPLYDNVDERHEREVKEAEAKARAEIVDNNPDVSEEDLEIKVSDAVKKAEDARLQRARQGYGGGAEGYMAYRMHMMNPPGRRLGGAGEGELDDMMDLLGAGRDAAGEGGGAAEDFANRIERMRQQRDRHREMMRQRQARNRRAAAGNGEAVMPGAFGGFDLQPAGEGQVAGNPFVLQPQAFMPFAGDGQQAQQPQAAAAQPNYQQAANQPAQQQQPLFPGLFMPPDNYADPPNLFANAYRGLHEDILHAQTPEQRQARQRALQRRLAAQQQEMLARLPQGPMQRAQNLMAQEYGRQAWNNGNNNAVAAANPRAPIGPFENYPDAHGAAAGEAAYPEFFPAYHPRVGDPADQRRAAGEAGRRWV